MSHSASFSKSISVGVLVAIGTLGGWLGTQFMTSTHPISVASSSMQIANPYFADRAANEENAHNGLLLAVAVATGAGAAFYAKQQAATPQSRKRSASYPAPSSLTLNQVNSKLQRQLLRLLHDDQRVATRLLTQAKLKYPDRSTDWCAEKVIYDLTRDRGGY